MPQETVPPSDLPEHYELVHRDMGGMELIFGANPAELTQIISTYRETLIRADQVMSFNWTRATGTVLLSIGGTVVAQSLIEAIFLQSTRSETWLVVGIAGAAISILGGVLLLSYRRTARDVRSKIAQHLGSSLG